MDADLAVYRIMTFLSDKEITLLLCIWVTLYLFVKGIGGHLFAAIQQIKK